MMRALVPARALQALMLAAFCTTAFGQAAPATAPARKATAAPAKAAAKPAQGAEELPAEGQEEFADEEQAMAEEGVPPAPGSGGNVTVTLDRLADDSVRAQRFVLTFTPDDNGWTLRSARVAQRCWPGRGHTTYSPEPCV